MAALQACSKDPKYRKEGVSRTKVYEWIGEHYPGTLVQSIRKTLNEAVDKDLVSKPSRQRFKLTASGKEFQLSKPRSEPKKSKKKKTTPKRKKKVSKKKASPVTYIFFLRKSFFSREISDHEFV